MRKQVKYTVIFMWANFISPKFFYFNKIKNHLISLIISTIEK